MARQDTETGDVTGTIFFDPADRIYEEHFPGHPVVPGSLIIRAFLEAAQQAGCTPAIDGIENFRFLEFLPPGEYPFSMKVLPDRLTCRLYCDDKTMVTGIIKR